MEEELLIYNPEGSDLRKAQKKMLEILIVFDEICRDHNIDYWLSSGTLLGARRHGGFIPWDDDLDVEVKYKDYNRLISILNKELPEELKVQTRNTDKNYWFYWAKIRDTKSIMHEDSSLLYNYDLKGIFIDIFPMVGLPTLFCKKNIDSILVKFANRKFGKGLLRKILRHSYLMLFPIIYVYIWLMRFLSKKFTFTDLTYNYGVFYYGMRKSSELFPLAEIEFEGRMFKCPNDVDGYLRRHFGDDYMQIPPKAKRFVHMSKVEFRP